MNFRETTTEDLVYVASHSVSRGIQKYCPEQIDYCFTLEHEGKPLAVGGFRLINLTTAWAWLDISDTAEGHIIPLYRATKEWIEIFAAEHGLKRLQAYVECDFEEAVSMVKHLGFNRESTMQNFIGNEPAYLYARLL